MDLKLNFIPLIINGYMILDLPPDVFSNLKEQCDLLLNNNFKNRSKVNENLYGAIEHEYSLNDTTLLDKFLKKITPEYYKFNYSESKNLSLEQVWINFQKKYEFNPLHNHSGELSFVIWIKIPYNLEEEKNHPSVKNSNKFFYETTSFSFVYPKNSLEVQGKILQIDKTYEGKMIIFNSNVNHIVHPFFTSDDFRISIAGNLYLID